MPDLRRPYAVAGLVVQVQEGIPRKKGTLHLAITCVVGTVFAHSAEQAEEAMLPDLMKNYPTEDGYQEHRVVASLIEPDSIRTWGYTPRSEPHVFDPGTITPN